MKHPCSSLWPLTLVNGRTLCVLLVCSVISACSTSTRFVPDALGAILDADGASSRVQADGRLLDGRAKGRFETGRLADVERREGNSRISAYQRDQVPPSSQPDGNEALSMAQRWRPPQRDTDQDGDGVVDVRDECPQTAEFVTVDRVGCGLFDAVLDEVVFESGSRLLSEAARSRLDRLAETLLAFPESRVQVRAHTDSLGSARLNRQLSTERAESVVQYLQSRGVHATQLQAVGMGESMPVANNSRVEGQALNRRVDVVTLPDQDAGTLAKIPDDWTAPQVIRVASNLQTHNTPAGTSAVRTARVVPQSHGKERSEAEEPALKAAAPRGTVRRASPPVMPLPEPGFAPGVRISGVVNGLSFATGSAELEPEVRPVLDQVSRTLLDNPQVRIVVMAHTDDTGDAAQNLRLSRQRAQSVVLYLAQQGVEPDRLDAEGYGELLPLVQNMTAEDRAINRRVEIRIQRN